ncbi:MAG: hypothetical protein J7K04_10105 [Spirochaetales bacterium]|nr:hypothetical protein [Spirochaetales bacterium]
MLLFEFYKAKEIRLHIIFITSMLFAGFVYISYLFTLKRTPLEIMQLTSTLFIMIHWWWGSSFYFYYFHYPRGKLFIILDLTIIVFIMFSIAFYNVYYLWSLFLSIDFASACFMYKLKPSSPHYDERVFRFVKKKSKLDFAVFFLFLLGFIIDLSNSFFLHVYSLKAFVVIATFCIIITSHIWILVGHFYSLK